MAKKLSDAEFVERTRTMNRRRSERQRQRLSAAGKTALTVWIPDTLKTALQTAAADSGSTMADTAAQWLMTAAALDTYHHESATTSTPPRNASNDATLDMFSKPETATMDYTGRGETATTSRVIQSDKDALMNEVGAMLESGLSGGEIARRWNSEGRRTANGSEYIGANILRDYRKWTAKQTAD
jgi:DNA-binding PadR family transcriptional regulator